MTDGVRTGSFELTVLMPCLNESETIGTCVGKALEYLRRSGIDGEVLVADNGSSDGSIQIAEGAGARVIAVPQKGYGSALLAGIAAARGRFTVMGDSDDSYDFSNLDAFVDRLRNGDELVMGNRFRGGIANGAMPFLHRYLGNPVLSFIGRLFFRTPIGDFHCGLRGFETAAVRRLGLNTQGMEFASEMVVKASVGGLRISEVPTTLSRDGRSTPPHLRTWRDGWRHLRFLLLLSPRWLFLYPGVALMAVGLAFMAALVAGPVHIGRLILDVNTLVYTSTAIICGFQLVALAIFSQVFASQAGLIPRSRKITWLFKIFRLETGILLGLFLMIAGIAVSVYAVRYWEVASFGPLDPQITLRIVVPAATAAVLGVQVTASSFFLSVLDLKTRAP